MTGPVLPPSIQLRPMLESDLPGAYRLEVMSQPLPWPLWFFRRQVRQGASCWVLEEDGGIVAFGMVAFARNRAHIMNMGVAPGYRRRGLGRRIMLHLLGGARHRHCRRAWLEVRRANRSATGLYRTLGLRTKAIREGYCPARTGRRNGSLMARPIRSPIREKH
jgi:ribosomal-protein-alanine N-acetyltransferase